jgi:hypothetical protein
MAQALQSALCETGFDSWEERLGYPGELLGSSERGNVRSSWIAVLDEAREKVVRIDTGLARTSCKRLGHPAALPIDGGVGCIVEHLANNFAPQARVDCALELDEHRDSLAGYEQMIE